MDGSIPGKLDRLLHHSCNLPKGATDEIPLIKGDLEKIIAIISNLENHHAMKARCWRKEVRELSYNLEDFLDQYEHAVQRIQRWVGRYSSRLVQEGPPKPTLQFCPWMKEWKLVSNKKERDKRMGERKNKIKSKAALPWLREKLRLRLWMANEIREFSVRVQEALQRHSSYNLDAIDGSSSTGCTDAYSASGNSICNEENTYVGIGAALEKLEELLMVKHDDKHHKLKIVSIVGFGGIGKTTLATELYCKFGLQFECRAFVRTAQKPDMRRIFISMLSQVRPHQPPDNWTVHGLISTIRTHLQDKRYLIIVEDLSATSTWDIVKCALPDSNCCSRILTTTEIEDLALQCCGHDPKHVYKMEPLGEENSRELFFSSVFGPQHECPPELKEISYDIIIKCGGLPLAIVTVASILSSQLATQDQWHYVNNSIGYNLLANHSLEGMKQVLDLSYNNLPHHLKACILYTCLYEEDIIIYRDDLVNQWIAEGFIQATEGQDKKEIARSFFDRLISAKLILPVDINRNGEVLSCMVHHMVLNLVIRYKSTEENFVTAIHHSQAPTTIADNVRRLSLQFGNAADAKAPVNVTLTHVRTLAIWGVFKCLPSVVQFPLLQVLILHFWGNKDSISFDTTGISELFRLRYLKVTSNVSLKLCTKMLSMQSLETLTIDARVSAVPSDIVHLPGLLHLNLPAGTDLPNGIGNLTSLRMLGYFDLSSNSMENVQSLRMLTNIEDLQLTFSTVEAGNLKEKMHFVLNSVLVTLRNLKSLKMVPRASSYAKSIDDAVAVGTTISVGWLSAPALLLQCLEVSPRICIFFCLPKWIGQLHKLCVLKFGVSTIDRDGVDILGGLPNLAVLSLYVHMKPEMGIVIAKTGFPVLKYFKFKCCDPCLKFEEGAMPNLRKLKLAFNARNAGQQNTIPVGINYLSELKEVSAKIGGAGPEESHPRAAKSAFRDAIRMHDRIQRVNIQSVKQIIFGNDDQSNDDQSNITPVEDLPRSGEETTRFQNESKQRKEEDNCQRDAHFSLDIDKLQQVVKTRWLKPQEVLKILQNHEFFTISHKPPQKPQSGSWFLFNRRVLRYFQNDGLEWQKKKNGKTINEAHERLKVDNVDALRCCYTRGDKDHAFQRRIYWMLDPAYEHIVLVHYRDVLEGRISVSARNDSSISNQIGSASRAEVHSSPGWASELIVQRPNLCSPGSADEVSSRTCASESDLIQHKAALRKLKMQLSLEDKEDCDVNADNVPANNEPIVLPGIQNEEPDTSRNHDDILYMLDFEDHINGTGTHPCLSAIDVLKNSDTWLEVDQLEAILHPPCMTSMENQWFEIHEVSPEFVFSSESTKVIIVGDFLCNPRQSSWEVLFGDVKVPVEIIQQGVIRCHTPCLNAGKVRMCLIDGNGKSCSEAREFEFLEKPTKGMIDGNRKPCNEAGDSKTHQIPTKSSDELPLLLHYVHTLFDGHPCGLFSNFSSPLPNLSCEFQINQMDIIKKTYEQLDPGNTVNSVMEALLNDKFKQWLSSKCEQNIDGDHLLPKQYHSIIHMIAALGYVLALKPLLSSGVPINYRDANGWTALHWAARFGREDMVVALLTAGAAAGALSHPTSEDPAAKTPASTALAYGFKGLSAFLSEAQLTTHLDSVGSKGNGTLDSREGGICRAVVRISDKSSHVDGGTDDQLALKDSLGAVRNAVQAAGCIQAAFRMFSFKKKKEMALQNRISCCLSISETGAVSHDMLEKAALSIQKNFRCWKKRKEFLRIRNNVVRIQARVRAHQERKKYKELLSSVGVLEKVMIRWYRKGVGLRGFNSGAMPIDEEVDEDIAKVFRKLRVETAIDEAVSRVSCIIGSPKATQQYRRMLKRYQQAKDDHER